MPNPPQKHMLILSGTGNCGKSTSLKLAYQEILRRSVEHVGVISANYLYSTPCEVAVSLKPTEKFGLASRGDSQSHVQEGLNFFANQKCRVIVCATRTKGGSYKAALDFAQTNGFEITDLQKVKETVVQRQKTANEQCARIISAWACRHLGI